MAAGVEGKAGGRINGGGAATIVGIRGTPGGRSRVPSGMATTPRPVFNGGNWAPTNCGNGTRDAGGPDMQDEMTTRVTYNKKTNVHTKTLVVSVFARASVSISFSE